MSSDEPASVPPISESDKAKARKWFERAKTVADAHNYEYAIEAYISGLRIWPEAVEEGHKPLRVVATARKMAGKKGLGFLESRKYPTSGKSPLENLLNAEMLWAHDPSQVSHAEAMVINAAKAGCIAAGVWIAGICADGLSQEKKVSAARYAALCAALESISKTAQKSGAYALALSSLETLVRIAGLWTRAMPTSQDAGKVYADAQSELAIVKGRFDRADSFHESLKDKEAQKDLHDKDRVVQSAERIEELLVKARAEYEADPQSSQKLNAYVDLLTRRELESDEDRAIAVLEEAWQRSQNYSFKVRADDIRIRQLNRRGRKLVAAFKADPDNAAARAAARDHLKQQLDFEIQSFQERVQNYPTDLKVRFALGERLFKAHRFDDAIPCFQQAQADGRSRDAARLYLGQCFFRKGLLDEAAGVLKQAFSEHDLGVRDDLGKRLAYWLARTYEEAGRREDAAAVYGTVIQADYNFEDARVRLEALRKD